MQLSEFLVFSLGCTNVVLSGTSEIVTRRKTMSHEIVTLTRRENVCYKIVSLIRREDLALSHRVISSRWNRPNYEILVPDWLITSHVT